MRLDATMALGRRPERASRGNIDLLARGGLDIPSPRPLLPILVAFTTKCSTKSSADRCTPLKGGSACVGVHASCCDACTASDCASPSGAFVGD